MGFIDDKREPEENETPLNDVEIEFSSEPESNESSEPGELEKIRDMFQQELDKQTEQYLAGGDLQDTEPEGEENPEDDADTEQNPNLCECCGENERDTSFGEDYPYCAECRDLMKKFPINFSGVVALILVLVMTGLSYYLLSGSNTLDLAAATLTADTLIAENKPYSGFYGYNQALNEMGDTTVYPKKLIAKYIKIYSESNGYNNAVSIINNFFTDAELKLPTYSFMNDYKKKADTYSACVNFISAAMASEGADYKTVVAQMDALREEEGADYDDYIIEYCKFYAMDELGATPEEQLEQLKSIKADFKDSQTIDMDICMIEGQIGDVEGCKKAMDDTLAVNSEASFVYSYLANAYRFSGKPDTDEMLDLVKKGFECQGNYEYASTELYRVQAIAYLLKGDYESAYKAADEMYAIVSGYQYNVNNLFQCLYTYALTALLTDNTDSYDSIDALLATNGYAIDESIAALRDTKITQETITALVTDNTGVLA